MQRQNPEYKGPKCTAAAPNTLAYEHEGYEAVGEEQTDDSNWIRQDYKCKDCGHETQARFHRSPKRNPDGTLAGVPRKIRF